MTVLRMAETRSDKEAAYRLRYELYVEDQGLFMDEADHEKRRLTDEDDPHSHVFIAEVDDRIVGTIRLTSGREVPFRSYLRETLQIDRFHKLVDEEDIMVISRFVLRKEFRGSGLGFQLKEMSFEFAAEQGTELILGNCEPHLLRPYRKYGYRPYGVLNNHPTNGLLVPIAVVCGDLEYLEHLDSPMLNAFRRRTKSRETAPRIAALVERDRALAAQDSMAPNQYRSQVAPLFSDLKIGTDTLGHILADERAAHSLLAQSHVLTCRPGDILYRKGHRSRTLYILLEGTLSLHDEVRGVSVMKETGMLIGEVAFFTGQSRMNDAVVGPVGARVLALSDRTLRTILAENHSVSARFLHYVTQQLCRKLAGADLPFQHLTVVPRKPAA